MIRATVVVGALALLQAVVYTPTLVQGSSVQRRDGPLLPFLDYEGIATAAAEAVQADGSALTSGSHSSTPSRTCREVKKRKEWRQLTKTQKKDYIRAIKCLQTKSDYGISPVSNTLYDAFTQVHQTNWTDFHGNAYFLPWHRWFVWVHSEAMASECGYTGPTPYWNYSMDYKNPFASPIFSTDETGFGSHGRQKLNVSGLVGFKVDNGPFANLKVNLPIPHYLMRNFSAWKDIDKTGEWGYALGEAFSPKEVARALSAKKFIDLEAIIDGYNVTNFMGLHNGPHFFNSGDWLGPAWLNGTSWFPQGSTAPNDPIFWNHHAYIDNIFWTWQQKPGKQWLFNGNTVFWNQTDDSARPTDLLPFYGLGPNPPVALALKTENWPLCYTY
ncbi:hypothetical protein FRC14_001776 [Serendipita sp. 396]|nr:hypothetical protein FRC14_001776 [Serendipita sp. 396]KAG8841644.1 hypothetical protein FRC20_004910 [Serendipita sp. 405]